MTGISKFSDAEASLQQVERLLLSATLWALVVGNPLATKWESLAGSEAEATQVQGILTGMYSEVPVLLGG